jgi:DNA-binding MarR family transcriptional regulator
MTGLSTHEFIALAGLRSALRVFMRQTEQTARRSGLTPQRHLLLLMIKGAPDGTERSTVTELSERLQLAQSTVTELVRRAEDAGLLEREQSESDGRVVYLRLTKEGERRLEQVDEKLTVERARLRETIAGL